MQVFVIAELIKSGAFLVRAISPSGYTEKIVQSKTAASAVVKVIFDIVDVHTDVTKIFVQNLYIRTVWKLRATGEDELAVDLLNIREAAPSVEILHVNSLKTEARFRLFEEFCTAKLLSKGGQNAA